MHHWLYIDGSVAMEKVSELVKFMSNSFSSRMVRLNIARDVFAAHKPGVRSEMIQSPLGPSSVVKPSHSRCKHAKFTL